MKISAFVSVIVIGTGLLASGCAPPPSNGDESEAGSGGRSASTS